MAAWLQYCRHCCNQLCVMFVMCADVLLLLCLFPGLCQLFLPAALAPRLQNEAENHMGRTTQCWHRVCIEVSSSFFFSLYPDGVWCSSLKQGAAWWELLAFFPPTSLTFRPERRLVQLAASKRCFAFQTAAGITGGSSCWNVAEIRAAASAPQILPQSFYSYQRKWVWLPHCVSHEWRINLVQKWSSSNSIEVTKLMLPFYQCFWW